MSEFESGYYRQGNGGEALVVASKATPRLPLRGIANIGTDSAFDFRWRPGGKSDGLAGFDLVEFLRPYTPPVFPKPDIIDGVGTYETVGNRRVLVLFRCNGDSWQVMYGNDRLEYYASGEPVDINHENSKVIVKKISNGIDLV